MSLIKDYEEYLTNVLEKLGYKSNKVQLSSSSKREFGQFQINVCMSLAKIYHESPVDIANKIKEALDDRFINVNIAGPGFINVTLNNDYLLKYLNKGINDFNIFIDKEDSKTIMIDYGGANAAKALHVGHMRSANIGEALRRLSKLFGNIVIGDVHLGDLGRQAGMIISEIKLREPSLPFFDSSYEGEYPKINYTSEYLGELYVAANIAAKGDEKRMEEVRFITAEIDKGNIPYTVLWKQLVDISSIAIKRVYDLLNCHFDLWEGELDSFKDIPSMLEIVSPYLYEDNGALIMDIKSDDDNKDIPPLIVIKKDGATIYATRDLSTIYSRVKRFDPNEMWYVVDSRQSLYFEQVFRASHKAKLVKEDCNLQHLGFGTINGVDGKPYKTRDGGVMELADLIELVSMEVDKKIKEDIVLDREDIKTKLTIAAIKYADLLPYRTTDYVFDPIKFSSLEGKTGPYILYTNVRLKSILNKVENQDYQISIINNLDMENILIKLLELPNVLKQAYLDRSLNYITEFLFEIASLFNKFYNNYHILTEENKEIKESYLGLVKLVSKVLSNLLNVLAIDEVDKM